MRITLLGTAAGGGFPQWNCNCRNCAGVRAGTLRAKARTQSSIFVQADAGADGLLFNASPDILAQIQANPALQPGRSLRDTAIAGVVLTDGQVDHCTGLLMLRERGSPLPLWCTDAVHEDLSRGFPLLGVMSHYCGVQRHRVEPDGSAFEAAVRSLSLRAVALRSQAAPYSPHRDATVPGDNIGLQVTDTRSGRSLFYAPGLAEITPALFDRLCSVDLVLVDGTFWRDDEMPALGLSRKTARAIGHLPQSGEGGQIDDSGMVAWLDRLPRQVRRVLVHINNTNPILDEDSAERALLTRHGIEVGEDGQTLDL